MLRLRLTFFTLLFCLLLFSLAGCSNPSSGTPSSAQSSSDKGDGNILTSNPTTSATSQPSPQTVNMPHTDTSCPSPGTARAAVIRPLAQGKHQNLVYTYRDTTQVSHLRRYDMATGQKTDILTLSYPIDYPQISSDGQWILFLANISQNDERLELARIDGQGLQTLYCFPHDQGVLSLQWSPDQKLVAYGVQMDNSAATDSIGLLNISSGTQKMLFQATNSDFYGRIAWLDNTHLYIDKEIRASSSPGTLYLMNVTVASVSNPGLHVVLSYTANTGYMSYKGDTESNKLYFAHCSQSTSSTVTTIAVYPATGGTKQAQFQVDGCIAVVQALSANSLFLLPDNSSAKGIMVSTVHTDGSSPSVLTTLPTVVSQKQMGYELHSSADTVDRVAQSPWFNFSRDESTYALERESYGCDSCSTEASIITGSLNGGNITAIATGGGDSVGVVGWTMI